jgi:putative endonuclease
MTQYANPADAVCRFEEQALAKRRASYRKGLWAETFASIALFLRGYRILARRCKTRAGEIDLIAVRGKTVVFVEVKARATLEDAQNAITRRQAERMRRAASVWIGRSPCYQSYEQRFDAVYVLPKQWPIHFSAGA